MKYISVVIFVVLMAWTWSLATTSHMPSLIKHKNYEAEIEEAIRVMIQEHNPSVTDINFRQLYTEVVRENAEVNVRFTYELKEPLKTGDVTAQLFKGSIKGLSSDGGETWTWTKQDISSPLVRFENGSRISIKDDLPEGSSEGSAPAPNANEQKPAAESSGGETHEGHQ